MQQCSERSQCKDSLLFSSVQISIVLCFAHLFFPGSLDGSVRGGECLAPSYNIGSTTLPLPRGPAPPAPGGEVRSTPYRNSEPQLVHSGPLCTANHPVRLFSSKVRGLPYGPWAILGGIELFVFPILEKRDVGSPLRLQPDHLAAAAIASIDQLGICWRLYLKIKIGRLG